MNMLAGSQLNDSAKREALQRFVNRFTGQHRPQWVNEPMPDGSAYPVQFRDDADWLANTRFYVTKNGRLDKRTTACQSSPTWPNNPELRTA